MNSNQVSQKNPQRLLIVGAVVIGLIVVGAVFFGFLGGTSATEENMSLSEEVKQAYYEAQELALLGEPGAAVERLTMELEKYSGNDPQDLYTHAKLNIYIADIYLSHLFEYTTGFDLLAQVYNYESYSNSVRGEALMLAMAHAFQALDEEAVTVADVRDMIFADQRFATAVAISPVDLALLDKPLETYQYFGRGFIIAAQLSDSPKVDYLAGSFSLRLAAPFVPDRSAGEYHAAFTAELEAFEAALDQTVNEYVSQGAPYQEFIAASYHNLARAYEALTPYEDTVVSGMTRIRGKLSNYAEQYGDVAYSAQAYLIGIDTRIVCRVVDDANFNSTNIDTVVLQPHLDALYENGAWVAPCAEAFELIASDIDPRFAQ